jgi:spermidine/putrescine-binding protein
MFSLNRYTRGHSREKKPHAPAKPEFRNTSGLPDAFPAPVGTARTIRPTIASFLQMLAVLFAILALGPGCSREEDKAPPVTGPRQPAEESRATEQPATAILRVLCKPEFLPETLLAEFTALTGVAVIVANPSDHPDLAASGASFDLALVDSLSLSLLIDEGALTPIDPASIPNIVNISPLFSADPFDPDGVFSVPFLWGTFGIAFNRDVVTGPDIEWEILFDRTFSGKIDMPDDIRLIVEAALRDLGTFLGEADTDTLNLVADRLLEQRKIVRGYFQIPEIVDHLADNSTYISFLDGPSAFSAIERNPAVEYIVPASGTPLWLLVWVIPAGSENADAARRLIDFLLDPKRIAAVSNAAGVANTVGGSRPYLDAGLVQMPTIILSDDLLDRCRLPGPIDLETENFIMRLKDDFM